MLRLYQAFTIRKNKRRIYTYFDLFGKIAIRDGTRGEMTPMWKTLK